MTKEEFEGWAGAVVAHMEHSEEEAKNFADQVEEHDKEAAAYIRKEYKLLSDLAAHLKERLAKG